MKKLGIALMVAVPFLSCDVNTSETKSKIDVAVDKLDSTAERVGEKAEDVWDSTKAKAKDLKEGIDSTFD